MHPDTSERFDLPATASPVALVTGAAGDIGRAIVLRLLQDGLRVTACDLDAAILARAYADTKDGAGDRLDLLACDVADAASVRQAVARVLARWGRVDALVNNAATVTQTAAVCDISPDAWQRTLDVNLTGAWQMACAVLPAMLAARRGVVLNMASQLGHVGAPGRGAYSVTKAGLLALTRAMAIDYADHGIRAVSLSPGPVLTSRVETRYGGAAQAVAVLGPRNLARGLGTVAQVAAAAAFLLGPDAAFVTGTDFLMDGGYTAV